MKNQQLILKDNYAKNSLESGWKDKVVPPVEEPAIIKKIKNINQQMGNRKSLTGSSGEKERESGPGAEGPV